MWICHIWVNKSVKGFDRVLVWSIGGSLLGITVGWLVFSYSFADSFGSSAVGNTAGGVIFYFAGAIRHDCEVIGCDLNGTTSYVREEHICFR